MIKKLIATGTLAAALALSCSGVAHATGTMPGVGGGGIALAPGTQACIQSGPAYYSMRASGNVVSGHNVRFTLSATGPSAYGTLDDTGFPVTSWAAQHGSSFQPWLFPSSFRACAINQSQKFSNVNLSLSAG